MRHTRPGTKTDAHREVPYLARARRCVNHPANRVLLHCDAAWRLRRNSVSRNATASGHYGCRVPLPWLEDGPSYGFGTGPSWLPQPPGWGRHSVAAQERDPSSTLAMYRAALAIRSERLTGDEQLVWSAPKGGTVIDFERGSGLRCLVNLGEQPVRLPAGRVLLASDPAVGSVLPPDTAVWLV